MRKFAAVLISAAAAGSICMNAFAAASVNVRVNYAHSTIDVEYESDLNYNTDTAFYIIKTDETFSLPDKPQRMATMLFETGKPVSARLKMGDDLSGEYRVYAVSGGYLSDESSAYSEPFKIIGSAEASEKLKKINNAAEAEILNTIVSELSDAADLNGASSGEWKGRYLYEIKKSDFGGSFKNISEIEQAWKLSDALKKINDSPQNETATAVNSEKDTLGISLEGESRIFTDEYNRLFYIAKQQEIRTLSSFIKEHEKAYAVASVNTAQLTALTDVMERYEEVLGITPLMKRYGKLDKNKFARNYFGFRANSISDVQGKFLSVIEDLEISSSGGSGGGGKSSSGGSVKLPLHNAAEAAVSGSDKPFSDVDETHWAYRAIKALSDSGILSGYEDGSFRTELDITREEFVKVIVSAAKLRKSETMQTEFSDAGTDH